MGYDYTEMDLNKRHSEFKCDNPTISFSTDNILAEITKDKGPKYINSNTDLFVFVTAEEYRLRYYCGTGYPEVDWDDRAYRVAIQVHAC